MRGGSCIREATEADLPALTAMTREFNAYLDALGGSEVAADAAAVAAAAMERLRSLAFGPNPLCTVLIAELDGQTVGYLNYYLGVYMDDATPRRSTLPTSLSRRDIDDAARGQH